MKHVVSFSGGRTSAYLVYLLNEKVKAGELESMDYIFMDTGAEHPETYKFIKKVVNNFNINLVCLRTKVIPEMGVSCSYTTVDISECTNDLVPFTSIIRKYGVPKNHMPHCTLHMKTAPFKKYCTDMYGRDNYITWLGIRIDEPRRLKPIKNIKYLADISDFDSDDIMGWWGEQSFDLGFDINSGWLGNCVFCHKKSFAKLALCARDEPELLREFDEMVNSENARQLGYTPKNQLYRQSSTIHNIIDQFSEFSRDEIINNLRHSKRFDNSACSESCEVFGEQLSFFKDWRKECQLK